MRTLLKLCLLAAAAVAAFLFLADLRPASAQSNPQGQIAFVAAGNGASDLYVLDLDTGAQTNLTQGRLPGVSSHAWSPDGTQIVVSADRGSNLYIIGADGTNLRALTHNEGFAITQTPTWSPDGAQIAYVGNAEQNYDLFVINADGTNNRRVTNTSAIYRDLAWSPDGSRIAYASGPDFFNTKIFVMNPDGTSPRQLSAGAGSDSAPAWSPDGSRIAYQNEHQFGPSEIFVMNADGSGQTRLTNEFRSDRHPTWSPDGSRIAFASDREDTYAVYAMNSDGTGQTRLTNNQTPELNPAWQPNKDIAAPTPTPTPDAAYAVTGRVRDLAGNALGGVLITFELNDAGAIQTRTTETDASGNYSSGALGCLNGVRVRPSKPGYTFAPEQINFVSTNCLTGSGVADFTATSDSAPRYTIRGRVTDGLGNGIADATVTMTGTLAGVATTDGAGNYSFAGLPAGGSYTLLPSKTGQFIKFARNLSNLGGDATLELLLLPYVNASVRVTDSSGDGVQGVSLRIGNSGLGAPLTNASGNVNVSVTYPVTAGETPITLTPVKYGYSFDPPTLSLTPKNGNQSFSFAATLTNRIYDPHFFVRQHYLDFLGREADDEGLAFWANNIVGCGFANSQCIDVRRVDTSAAFFFSIEFKETGYFVYRTYAAAFGNLPGKPVPLTRQEFLADTGKISEGVVVNSEGWEQKLAVNQSAYLAEFVASERFLAKYPESMDGDAFTYALYTAAGVEVTGEALEKSRTAFGVMPATLARQSVLRELADSESLQRREFNRAFVLMQYFGYLRRDPDSGRDADFTGYEYWLKKLEQFGGNYQKAEMVKAFITSTEYLDRFAQQQ